MAYALARQHARLIRAYATLRDYHRQAVVDRDDARDEARELRRELREVKRELRAYDDVSIATMGRLFSSVQYAITHLVNAGDDEAAEKLSVWLDDMRGRMRPLADERELVELLCEWIGSIGQDQSVLFMRTMQVLNDLLGRPDD